VVGDRLRVFERALVLEVGGNSRRTERVVADPGLDARVCGPALNHPVGVLLPHRLRLAGLAAGRTRFPATTHWRNTSMSMSRLRLVFRKAADP
jgi:hypothetical protein